MAKIRIVRKAHDRKGYRRKDGVWVKAARVRRSTFLVDDPGKPGRRARGSKAGPHKGSDPWISKSGGLGGPGYTNKSQASRRAILRRKVGSDGYREVLGRIMALERSSELSRAKKRKLKDDRRYLVRNYGGPGSFGPRR